MDAVPPATSRQRIALLGTAAPGRDWSAFRTAIEILLDEGVAEHDIAWAESAAPPCDPDEFGRETIYVIANSGMRFTVAQGIFRRVMAALEAGGSAHDAFGHKGKASAMDLVWRERASLLAGFLAAEDRLAFCASIPWIGGITKYHLAKNFGVDVAKPDIHLARLARLHATDPQSLCAEIARATGWRIATVDTLLWRACATGILCGHTGAILRRPAS